MDPGEAGQEVMEDQPSICDALPRSWPGPPDPDQPEAGLVLRVSWPVNHRARGPGRVPV